MIKNYELGFMDADVMPFQHYYMHRLILYHSTVHFSNQNLWMRFLYSSSDSNVQL